MCPQVLILFQQSSSDKTNDMKKFYVDCIGGLGQSILNSTGDEFMSKETNNLCEKLIKHLKNNSNK